MTVFSSLSFGCTNGIAGKPITPKSDGEILKNLDKEQKNGQKPSLDTMSSLDCLSNMLKPTIVFINEDKEKLKNVKLMEERVAKGLNSDLAEKMIKNEGMNLQNIVAKDNDGNYIFPNKILNDLNDRGFQYTNNPYGHRNLGNGDIIHIGHDDDSERGFKQLLETDAVKVYSMSIYDKNKGDSLPYVIPKERFTVVTYSDGRESHYFYTKYEQTPFGMKEIKVNGKLSELQ